MRIVVHAVCLMVVSFLRLLYFVRILLHSPVQVKMSDNTNDKVDLSGVTTFNKAGLKKTETQEKNSLPTKASELPFNSCLVSV